MTTTLYVCTTCRAGEDMPEDATRPGTHLLNALEAQGAPEDAPQIQLTVHTDPMAGYNLNVQVENFVFSPQQASLAHVNGQGHAHVYVNGVKQARLYGAWAHLDGLPKGEVTVEVTLNSNNHQPLAVEGEPIKASTMLVVE